MNSTVAEAGRDRQQATAATVRSLAPTELDEHLPVLTDLFIETVNGGVPMGFIPPLTRDQSRNYWLSVRREMENGNRLLVAVFLEDELVGSGQLELSMRPNSPHRAELQKLFVTMAVRGRGAGKSLMVGLHDTARQHNRSLILLNTRKGLPAEEFYKALGYREVGVIPGWSLGPAGERYDHVTLYLDLGH